MKIHFRFFLSHVYTHFDAVFIIKHRLDLVLFHEGLITTNTSIPPPLEEVSFLQWNILFIKAVNSYMI